MRRRSKKGAGLASLALPLLSIAIVPIGKTVGKAVLGGGIASQGIGSLFKKMLGGKRKRKSLFKRKVTFRPYLKA